MELAFSTDPDWCPKCRQLPCACSKRAAQPSLGDGKVKMRREKRRGKDLVVLFETGMSKDVLQNLLKELQKACGTGGAVKGDTIEIQGDHRDTVAQVLQARGLKVTRAGG